MPDSQLAALIAQLDPADQERVRAAYRQLAAWAGAFRSLEIVDVDGERHAILRFALGTTDILVKPSDHP